MTEDTSATFTLGLRDEISSSATAAAGTLAFLRDRFSSTSSAATETQKALKKVDGGTKALGGGAKTLGAGIGRLKTEIMSGQGAMKGAAAATSGLGADLKDGAAEVLTFQQRLAKQPGVAGAMAKAWGKLSDMWKTSEGRVALVINGAFLLAGATLAAVGAVFALVGAAVSGAAALARLGVAHADARRNELLHLEGLTLMRRHMGLARGSAAELQGAIDRVSATSALGRTEISGMAERLYRMGLRGDNLTTALEGTAIATSVLGEEGGRRFSGMAAGIVRTGGSVRRLADDIRSRLGGVAARQAIGLDAQMNRLREGFGGLFDLVNIEPFLRGLNSITSLFSRGSVVSTAWRSIMASLFNPFLAGSEDAGGAVRFLIERITIGALRGGIAILRIRNALREVDEGFNVTRNLGAAMFREIGVAADGVRLAIRTVGNGMIVVGATGVAAGLALAGAWTRVRSIFVDTEWSSIGRSLVEGLVRGIRSGGSWVTETVRGLATNATATIRSALGIRSPSTVFAGLGVELPRGLAVGVERGTPTARGAVESMAEGTARSFDEAPVGGALAGRGASSVSIGPIAISVSGNNAQEVVESLRDQLGSIFEGIAIEIGAPSGAG